MELTLENQTLRVEISSIGAELMSVYHKESGREYLWQGDPAVWGRRSPILFPNCGSVKHGSYTIDGKLYKAGQHGFARDLNHKVVLTDDRVATFRLESGPDTLTFFPYRFALKTSYKLEKNSLVCRHKVINYDDKTIYFSFGFHTGINCPFVPGTRSADYDIVFQRPEDCTVMKVGDSGFINPRAEPYQPASSRIPITPGVFTNSLILKDPTSQYIQLQERSSGDYVRINGTNSPYTVIWSAPDDVRVVCIEPWYGMGDTEDFNGDFTQKVGINSLEPMEEFVCQQVIEIGVSKK